MKRLLLLLLLTLPTLAVFAQPRPTYTVTGRVVDAEDRTPLPGVNVWLWLAADSSQTDADATDPQGTFVLQTRQTGLYRIRLTYIGYDPYVADVQVDSLTNSVGTIALHTGTYDIGEVLVESVQERVRMRGDTTVYNADAFKVNPNASAEDLIGKMPGVVVGQDGTVEAQGEQVQRVMVDGREFFGGDPAVALRNLPADVIESVEVYDRQSDQAQFTGFNDGNTEKTINIVTRPGTRNGQFGKVYGGYGDDARYITGGSANIFDDDRRISIIGLSNNINQQNFAFEDLLGMSGNGGGRGGPGMRRGGGGGGGRWRGGGDGFNPRDFLIGQQSGINHTTSVGLNYSDEIGSRLKLNGSYFFNRMANDNDAFLDRELFLPDAATQLYTETTQSTSTNYNHRLNARIEYTIDENNSLLIRPRFSFQDYTATSRQQGVNVLDDGDMLNRSLNAYTSSNAGYTSSTSVLYRHRFPRRGRTLSAELDLGLNDRWGDTDQRAVTEFYHDDLAPEDSTYDQEIDSQTAGRSIGVDLDYTEPVGQRGQLRLSYEPSYGRNVSDRLAYVQDLQTGRYTLLDPTFSSQFDNDVIRQRGGATYQFRQEDRFSLQVGLEVQHERLLGDQTYPVPFTLDRAFFSLLPEVELEFEFGDELDLDIDYRTSTNTPSVSQLQDVIDNTNPLFLTTGNPDLKPSYTHEIRLRGRRGNWRAGRMLFAFASLSYERDPIGTASLLAVRDTVLARGVTLQQGSQFSYPVNLSDPTFRARSFVGLGRPFPLLKSNLNLRGGLSYTRSPGLINGAVNMASQYAFNGGLTLGSNISERLDFTVSYRADYTVASNSFYTRLDENYFRHDAGLRFAWLPVGGLVIETSLSYNDYVGLDEELYPTTFIVNAGLGYQFMQQDAAEVKLVVGDLFNQDTGVSRSITEMYVQDTRTQVLGRYVLLNLSYKFRNFGL